MKKSKELNGKVKCSKCGMYYIPRGGKAHCKEDVIPTAEEFFEQGGTYPELAIKFTKLHVEAALKAIADKSESWRELKGGYQKVDKESILNAYPLKNIV